MFFQAVSELWDGEFVCFNEAVTFLKENNFTIRLPMGKKAQVIARVLNTPWPEKGELQYTAHCLLVGASYDFAILRLKDGSGRVVDIAVYDAAVGMEAQCRVDMISRIEG